MPRTGSLTWANDLATRPAAPAELVADAAGSSPSAVKRHAKQERFRNHARPAPSAAAKQAQPASTTATVADASSPNQSTSRIAKPAAPVPKRAPIRSATLDPSHLAGRRQSSSEVDDAAAEDQELVAEMDSLSIVTNDAADDAGPAPPQHDLASSGYHSPPAFVGMGHAHRASGSFPPPPFGPGEGFMHPSSYLPAAAHALPMSTRTATPAWATCCRVWRPSTCLATSRIAPRPIRMRPPCLAEPSSRRQARRAPHRRVRRSGRAARAAHQPDAQRRGALLSRRHPRIRSTTAHGGRHGIASAPRRTTWTFAFRLCRRAGCSARPVANDRPGHAHADGWHDAANQPAHATERARQQAVTQPGAGFALLAR